MASTVCVPAWSFEESWWRYKGEAQRHGPNTHSKVSCNRGDYIIGLQAGHCCARALFVRIQATGKIKGIVLDPNEARIPAVTILIEGGHVTRRLTTNDLGEYESEVPAGTYHIKADLPNYFPFQRAAIRVESGKTVTINVAPAQRVLSVGLEVTEQGVQEPVRMAPLPQYEIFALRSPPRDDLDVLVQYQRRTL